MLEVILALLVVGVAVLLRDLHLLMKLNTEVAKNQMILHQKVQHIIDAIIRASEAHNGKE
jgi:Tfp pilus assembly protein PilV